MKIKSLKPLWIILIVAVALVLLAVLVGVLNATVGGGKWKIGWSSYRYDDGDFEVGGGTVYASAVNSIEIDWLNGRVETVVTDDAYLSISESCEEAVSDVNTVRWSMGSDGKLTVKHRASGYYFGHAPKKVLTVRIPKKMLSEMACITVKAESADVLADSLSAKEFCVETVSGSVLLSNCQAQALKLETVSGGATLTGSFDSLAVQTVSGDVSFHPTVLSGAVKYASTSGDFRIALAEDAAFRVIFDTTSGTLSSDFALQSDGDGKIFGNGSSRIEISTGSGDAFLEKKSATAP